MKKIFVTFFCLLGLLLQAENISAGNPKPIPVDSEELKKSMQEHVERMRTLKPGKHQEMVDKAGGRITNCCSCHVELCEKGAGQVIKK